MLKIQLYFGNLLQSNCPNMAISEGRKKSLKSGNFGTFFPTKILCMSGTGFFWVRPSDEVSNFQPKKSMLIKHQYILNPKPLPFFCPYPPWCREHPMTFSPGLSSSNIRQPYDLPAEGVFLLLKPHDIYTLLYHEGFKRKIIHTGPCLGQIPGNLNPKVGPQ